MLNKIEALLTEIKSLKAESAEQAEELRIKYLSKKGLVSSLFDDFKSVPPSEKKAVGMALNQLKTEAQSTIQQLKEQFENGCIRIRSDLTLPGTSFPLGGSPPPVSSAQSNCGHIRPTGLYGG
jgi:phenylalanyl-tRNA synthetase alpha chain